MKAPKKSPFAGLEVYIETTDGERLNEYDISEEDAEKEQDDGRGGPVQRCYLECPEDLSKSFRIVVRSDRPLAPSDPKSKNVGMRCFLDGRLAVALLPSASTPLSFVCDNMLSSEEGVVKKHDLIFSRPTTMEGPANPSQNSNQKDVGEIKITFDFGVGSHSGRGPRRTLVNPVVGPMNEKMKKGALDRVITGSKGTPCKEYIDYYDFEYRDPKQKPGYTMIFKYHSRQMLMAKDIIARPTPPPETLDGNEVESPRKSPVISDHEKRVKELEAELARLREQIGVKRERDPSSSTGPRLKRKKGNMVGNPIDLTEDDD